MEEHHRFSPEKWGSTAGGLTPQEAWERKLREREGQENTKGTAHLKAGKALAQRMSGPGLFGWPGWPASSVSWHPWNMTEIHHCWIRRRREVKRVPGQGQGENRMCSRGFERAINVSWSRSLLALSDRVPCSILWALVLDSSFADRGLFWWPASWGQIRYSNKPLVVSIGSQSVLCHSWQVNGDVLWLWVLP